MIRFGAALTQTSSRASLEDFCGALGAAGGFEVKPVGVWYYQRLLEALEAGDIDVAWLPPILAAQAMTDGRALPLAVPVRGGVSSYSAALFVREGSPIRRLADLTSARAAWVDRQSVSGYLLIRAHLRACGVDPDRCFSAHQFLGSHEAAVKAVLDGAADAGSTFVYFDASGHMPLRSGWGQAKVRVIASAGPIPSDVLAVSDRLPEEQARTVQRLLLHHEHAKLRTASDALLGADAFALPKAAHLEALAALLPSIDEHALPRRPRWPRG